MNEHQIKQYYRHVRRKAFLFRAWCFLSRLFNRRKYPLIYDSELLEPDWGHGYGGRTNKHGHKRKGLEKGPAQKNS